MSVITILLLVFIAYFCFKAIRNIWRDAFRGISGDDTRTRRNNINSQYSSQYSQKSQSSRKPHHSSRTSAERPIQKGEGDYVEFEEC